MQDAQTTCVRGRAFGVPGSGLCTRLVCVGMDAEWKAATNKGEENPASILQVRVYIHMCNVCMQGV